MLACLLARRRLCFIRALSLAPMMPMMTERGGPKLGPSQGRPPSSPHHACPQEMPVRAQWGSCPRAALRAVWTGCGHRRRPWMRRGLWKRHRGGVERESDFFKARFFNLSTRKQNASYTSRGAGAAAVIRHPWRGLIRFPIPWSAVGWRGAHFPRASKCGRGGSYGVKGAGAIMMMHDGRGRGVDW